MVGANDDYEGGLAALAGLVSAQQPNAETAPRNEATTRLQVIDALLFDCLGWTRKVTTAEEYRDDTYVDYLLGQPARAVVEAKREGLQFALPAGTKPGVMHIRRLVEDPVVHDALKQALAYAQMRGVAIAAICNGHQLVAFVASRQDGIAPLDGRALVFPSLDSMHSDFRNLWNALSPAGLEDRVLITQLAGSSAIPPPSKLSTRLQPYPGTRARSELQTELQILGGLFIEDIVKAGAIEEDFLRECYCPSGALSQYAYVSKEILRNRYSAETTAESDPKVGLSPAADKSGVAAELSGDVLAAALSRRPIILLGDVGVGKTMFIRRLIHVDAQDVLKKAIVLYIDLGVDPPLDTDLAAHLTKRFREELLKLDIDIEESGFVRGVYHGDLLRFRASIEGELQASNPEAYKQRELEMLLRSVKDENTHFRRSLEHLVKARRQQVVIFLDNVDQRQPQFQDTVFLLAQGLAEQWPATVFVSIRPETFHRSRREGSLTAYQPRAFTIAPPRIDLVLNRRIAFARSQLEGGGALPSFPAGVTLNSSRLLAYLRALEIAFQSNQKIVEFLDNMSNGNVREALTHLETFIGSPQVQDTRIRLAEDKLQYRVSVHEVMRAVLYGDAAHFDPNTAPMINLFDVSVSDGREHFLTPSVLSYVEQQGISYGDGGFIDVAEVTEHFQAEGFAEDQVRFAVRRCTRTGLLGAGEVQPQAVPQRVRITQRGGYAYKRLLDFFVYYDAVVTDTPIMDYRVRGELQAVRTLRQRVERARIFLRYLDNQWAQFDGLRTDFDWEAHSAAVNREMDRIEPEVARDNA